MTETLASHIEAVAAHAALWGLPLVLLLMTIESSFIPFPSEIVMIPAGFLAARGAMATGEPLLDAALSIVAGTVGSLLGAYVNYFLALRVGQPFLLRYGRYFFLPPERVLRAEEIFRRYGAGATFVCRLLPAIRQLISLPAGLARMPLGSFTLWTGLGAGIWVTVLTVLGYSFGASTAHMSYRELIEASTDLLRRNYVYVVPVLLLALVAYVVISRRIMRRDATGATGGSGPTAVGNG
ncbi:MAG: DedA family protein [Myxococcota bacterium]|nr:DedA family protein [Myxococcota bacterium]MDW8363342.1 DedA family protein [Myxococcales bacterium]